MKKTLTPEQKQKAEARRARFRELCKKLAGMSDVERAELAAKAGAVLTCEGHPLSGRNTFLLYLQRPGVSMVGGFRQWLKAGRCVKKGESGLSILVPCGRKESAAVEETGEGGGSVYFIAGTVFDVSQTQELEAAHPVAVVSPEIADAFGMRGLSNVRVDDDGAFELEGGSVA